MAWRIEWDQRALRDAESLDHEGRKRITRYLRERIATDENPRRFGKPLTGDKAGLWRYRVGDYRMVCRIEQERLVVLVITAGHRREVYD